MRKDGLKLLVLLYAVGVWTHQSVGDLCGGYVRIDDTKNKAQMFWARIYVEKLKIEIPGTLDLVVGIRINNAQIRVSKDKYAKLRVLCRRSQVRALWLANYVQYSSGEG